MKTERITFKGHSGDDLAARLDLPDGPILATALFAHCFTCSKDIPAARRISQRLAAMGIAVLRFDFTGLGHSGGEFANTHFTSNVADLIAAAAYLEGRKQAPALLVGHSLGGAAVIKAAPELASVKAVATLGAPFDPEHVIHNFGDKADEIARDGEAEVCLGGRPFVIRQSFLEDVSRSSLSDSLANLKRALLVMHAPLDDVVGIENASAIFTEARHPKSFVTLDDADHLITREVDANYAAGVISAWAGRYLDLGEPERTEGAPEGVVRVQEADPQGFLQDIAIGPRHVLNADEPASVGGTNAGPTPFQLVSAGLGACTTMTLRMYARRKSWAMQHVSVDVTHNKIHASECETCETDEGKVDRFTRVIHIVGDLGDAERTRLLEIADRCPVHRMLESEASIVTELAQ